MKITLSAPTIIPADILFGVCEDTQVAPPATPLAPLALPAGVLYILKNVSPAAQTIRVGFAPSYVAPVHGITLNVNDTLFLDSMGLVISAVASAAGALLDVLIFS